MIFRYNTTDNLGSMKCIPRGQTNLTEIVHFILYQMDILLDVFNNESLIFQIGVFEKTIEQEKIQTNAILSQETPNIIYEYSWSITNAK